MVGPGAEVSRLCDGLHGEVGHGHVQARWQPAGRRASTICTATTASVMPTATSRNIFWNDDQRIELEGKTYAQELIQQDVEWVRANAALPFFLYAITLPHGKLRWESNLESTLTNRGPIFQKTYAAIGDPPRQ